VSGLAVLLLAALWLLERRLQTAQPLVYHESNAVDVKSLIQEARR
jgi:hypothetical protein